MSWIIKIMFFVVSVLLCGSVVAGNNSGGAFSAWPDTGQTRCFAILGPEMECMPEGGQLYGQDAQYPGLARSFSILSGGSTAKDNVTGLIWERKESKDSIPDYNNPHDADNGYTWCDTNTATNGGNQGICGINDTEDFINALNTVNFGGYEDWRLPTVKEMLTLLDYSRGSLIDPVVFPNSRDVYWSSTTLAGASITAWSVVLKNDTDGGPLYDYYKSIATYVRAVRGNQVPSGSRFVDNQNGTVDDTVTCLQWQQATMDTNGDEVGDWIKWEQALSTCENLELAGHSDWRLPNINELRSLVDYSRAKPSIDPVFFPDTELYNYWSSTTISE